MGEFIFDAEWAQYAQQLNIKYYPKLLCGVPFTPVSCRKILMSPGLRFILSQQQSDLGKEEEEWQGQGQGQRQGGDGVREFRMLVAKIIKNIATSNNLSSVHLNFLTNEEALDIAGPLSVPKFVDTTAQGNSDNDTAVDVAVDAFVDADGTHSSSKVDGQSEGTPGSANANANNNNSNNNNNNNSTPIQQRVKSVFNRIVNRDRNDLYIRRTSLQYHWLNINRNNNNRPYSSFDDYLSCFKSKRRITIKRERRRVLEEQNIRVDAIKGRDILKYPGLVERMFEIYKSTVDKMFFGRQYLTLEFFQKLVDSNDFVDNLLFMCARYNDDELKAENIFAGTFNVVKDKVFYGRYWGCLPGFESKNLHFEVCYWSAIEYCIANNYRRIEPGAGGGDYKWGRG